MLLALALLLLVVSSGLPSCGHQRVASAGDGGDGPDPLTYVFPGVDGEPIDSETHQGRVTVLLFITTFDIFSQAQASRLEDLYRSREPRINAAAIVLEAPRNADLVASFVEVLKLSYPVGIADSREVARHEWFGNIQSVPAWVFLDAAGRPRAVGSGALTLDRLNELLDEVARY